MKILPEDRIIYNFGRFNPVHDLDGRRTQKVEQALIKLFRSPGPPVWDKDCPAEYPENLNQYFAEVFNEIRLLSQDDAIKHLLAGNLRRFIRARSLDRFRDFKKRQYAKKRSAQTGPLIWGHGLLSVGISFPEAEMKIEKIEIKCLIEKAFTPGTTAGQVARFYLEHPGLTNRQMAKKLHVSEAAIRKALQRIRKIIENN